MDQYNDISLYVIDLLSAIKKENKDRIIASLTNGVDADAGIEYCAVRMAENAFELSFSLAVQTILQILVSQDVIPSPKPNEERPVIYLLPNPPKQT